MPNDLKNKFIAVNAPVISKEAKKYVNDCLETGWISSAGPYVEKFERGFAEMVGVKYGIAVCNGTAALHTALLSLGIKPGDEVIVPAFTMIATIFSVLYTGATPVFVDCEKETFNLDPSQIEEKITPRTRAIMPVHLFGHACEMDAIQKIAQKHRLLVIEDAAEAHGGLYKGRKCGSLSDVACFSFYANKILTTGEGGMVLTNDAGIADRAKGFRDLCHSPAKRFIHENLGYNYRMTNVQAAIGCGELENLDRYIERKISMADRYNRLLKDVPGIRAPVTLPHVKNVYWMYTILVEPDEYGMTKDELRQTLKKENIDTRDLFYSPTDQPILKKMLKKLGAYPNTEYVSSHGCYLPSGLAITDEQIDFVGKTIQRLHS